MRNSCAGCCFHCSRSVQRSVFSLPNKGGCRGWADIKKDFPAVRHDFDSYKIQTIEVDGELREVVDLFVRINSTGKPLTSGEKRHARFFESRFLKEADRLVKRPQPWLLKQRVLSSAAIDRMKGTELFSELLMSIHQGGIINKKIALDRAIGNDSINGNTLTRISRECVSTLNTIKRILPELRQTRFHNTADFYSVFMVFWKMRSQSYTLNDGGRNRVAEKMLLRLSNGVDDLRDQQSNPSSISNLTSNQSRLNRPWLVNIKIGL